MLKKNFLIKYNSSSIIIFFFAIIFSVLVGSGLYGYGIDYYGAYSKGFEWSRSKAINFDYIGYKIATLIIFDYYIGVYITTFILALSAGYFIKAHLEFKQSYSIVFFLFILVICVHTWPIIMSTSNAMRQGLVMSFIFLSLSFSFNKKYYWMIFFSILALIMHKTGPLFVAIIFVTSVMNKILESFHPQIKTLINFLSGISMFFFTFFLLKNFILPADIEPTRIIKNDFRLPFVLISVIYIIFFLYFKPLNKYIYFLSLYYFSFISLAFLMNGLNWQYERLGMMMLIPYIMSYGAILKKNFYRIYLVLVYSALLLMTLIAGIYSDGMK